MTTLTVRIDERTEAGLEQMSTKEGRAQSQIAARLLARAVLSARLRPVIDEEALKAYARENADEELALADSDLVHRAELLVQEDVE